MNKTFLIGLFALAAVSTQASAASIILGSNFTNGTSVYTQTFSDGLSATFTGSGSFSKKSQAGVTGVGISGRTNGEIDIGESISASFSSSVLVSSIKLGLLFDGPEYNDVNEIAKLSVLYADGSLADFTLTAKGPTTAIWSGSSGSVTSLGNGAISGGTGAWELSNPFGTKAIKGITFGALQGLAATSCPSCSNQSDYTFVSIEVNKASLNTNNISSVPVPAAAWLFGSGLLGLAGLRRKQA